MAAIAAEQATDLADQAVAAIRAGEQVGGRVLEKLLERAFVLQQWHGQVTGMKQQAGTASAEPSGAREEQFVFAGMAGLVVGKGGLLEADALANQPTAEAMPDDQQAFHQKVIRVPQGGVVHAEPRPVAFALDADGRGFGEQAVKQRATAQGFFQ